LFEIVNIRSDQMLQIARIETFLLENPDPGVRIRPKEQMQNAFDLGHGLLVTRNDSVEGVSLVFKYEVPPTGTIFSEIGTMRVVATGYDLQAFLASFHLLQLYLEEQSDKQQEVFAVVTPGTASEHNLQTKVGMQRWDPPIDLKILRQNAGMPFNPEKSVILADLDSIRRAFINLRRWHVRDNIFQTPKNAESILIRSGWFSPDALNYSP